jgi:hypothetical protein
MVLAMLVVAKVGVPLRQGTALAKPLPAATWAWAARGKNPNGFSGIPNSKIVIKAIHSQRQEQR